MAKYDLMDERHLRHLQRLAEQGDETALDLIKQDLKRTVKAANSRLLRLERSGYAESSQAYGEATLYTDLEFGTRRYRVNNKMGINELVEEYRDIRAFMDKQTSTVRGIKIIERNTIDTLKAYGIDIDKEVQRDFFIFLRTNTVQDVIDYVGEYSLVVDFISNSIGKDKRKFDELYRQFNLMLEGELYFDEIVEKEGISLDDLYSRSITRRDAIYKKRRRNKKTKRK